MKEEKEEQLLNAIFDGEITEAEIVRIGQSLSMKRLQMNETQMKSELEALRSLRQLVRSWHQETVLAELRQKPLDVWRAIEQQIAAESRPSWKSKFVEFFSDTTCFVFSPGFAGGFVSAALLMFFSYSYLNRGRDASVETPRIEARGSNNNLLANLNFDSAERLNVGLNSRQAVSHSVIPIPEAVASRLSEQLIVDNNLTSGRMKTAGAEIEWIKAKRPFRLVSARKQSAPPVVWVSNSRPGQ